MCPERKKYFNANISLSIVTKINHLTWLLIWLNSNLISVQLKRINTQGHFAERFAQRFQLTKYLSYGGKVLQLNASFSCKCPKCVVGMPAVIIVAIFDISI